MWYYMAMQKEQLEAKKVSINEKFEALQESNKELQKQVEENNLELLKLAGEYRAVEELLAEWDKYDVFPAPKKTTIKDKGAA